MEKVPGTTGGDPHSEAEALAEAVEEVRAVLQNPPERIIYRPLGLSVTKGQEITTLNLLIGPGRVVQVELIPEGSAALLKELTGGIVPATLADIPKA